MRKHKKRMDSAVEHRKAPPKSSKSIDTSLKKSMQALKKKSALLSAEFEAEEEQKSKARENQIRMLEATKKKLEQADDFDVNEKKDEPKELKKKDSKKKSKWPKMEI